MINTRNKQELLFSLSTSLLNTYVIITDQREHFYISHPNDSSFIKLRGNLYMNRDYIPFIIDTDNGWSIFSVNKLEEALNIFTQKFK